MSRVQDRADLVHRIWNPMSGQNIRNVPVRRNIRSSSTCHTVTESYEHHQSDVPGAGEPEDTGRGRERTGKETRGCTQGVLCWECVVLYHKHLYIMHHIFIGCTTPRSSSRGPWEPPSFDMLARPWVYLNTALLSNANQ